MEWLVEIPERNEEGTFLVIINYFLELLIRSFEGCIKCQTYKLDQRKEEANKEGKILFWKVLDPAHLLCYAH